MAKLKRRHKRKLILFVLILVIGLLSFSAYKYFTRNNEPNNSIFNNKKDDKEKENPIKTYTAKLIATGDGLIHSPLYNAAKTSTGYDFSNMLTLTKNKIKNYDIKYYNQETVSDDSKSPTSYPIFNTPSAYGKNMIEAGFNLVSLASNHSMDAGATSAKASASWWQSQDSILATGMFATETDRNNYKIMEANGIKYTMLSYTYGTNGIPVPASSPYLVNVFNEEMAKKDIEAVRDKVDVLIVAMHWGNEYNLDATETQKKQAKFLADNNVDIVLGTHSHCVEPWEWINDTVVFYSFGNFISNQMGANEAKVRKVGSIGVFATLDITKTVDTEKNTTDIKIDNIGADLTYTYRYHDSSIGKNNYLVIPFSMMSETYLHDKYNGALNSIKTIYGKDYNAVYEEYSSVLKKYDSSIKIEPIAITN